MNITIENLNKSISIDGLHWVPRWRAKNGKANSYVIPFPTLHPINLVYHGEKDFSYGQYGIHLGQQDILTFLGDNNQTILAKFIDCRIDSPSYKKKLTFEINPSSAKSLIIPPGIAHTFHNLKNIFTINNYKIYLPDIKELSQETMKWSPDNDVLNIPEEISPDDIPGLECLKEEAADIVYYRIAEHQERNLYRHAHLHSETREFKLDDGEKVTLRIREKLTADTKPLLPISSISGVSFHVLPSVITGSESCIIPLTRKSPMYLVEHGQESYDFDSYGLHLGQEDHLSFLGKKDHILRLKIVDLRANSPTLFKEEELIFNPLPDMELTIPCGVAHAFFNMAGIITINRPVIYINPEKDYIPGHDVIDWPIEDKNYISFTQNDEKADMKYYEELILKQQETLKTSPSHNTPKSVLIWDEETGKPVKVLLKKKA